MFTRTKHGANRLAEQLERDGISAAAIHGNKSQPQRVRALGDFKAGRVAILVATDIAARGLDIESLPHVVNYELPMVPHDYIHRIGRTGRAGVDGEAISLVCVDEARLLRDIEALLGHRVPSKLVEGFEPDRSIRSGADPPADRWWPPGRASLRGGARPCHARPGRSPLWPAGPAPPGASDPPASAGPGSTVRPARHEPVLAGRGIAAILRHAPRGALGAVQRPLISAATGAGTPWSLADRRFPVYPV